jgi:hypothetical protein
MKGRAKQETTIQVSEVIFYFPSMVLWNGWMDSDRKMDANQKVWNDYCGVRALALGLDKTLG